MILLWWVTSAALAGPVEQIGFGARSMGRGSGGMGLVDSPAGVFLNPAGLVRLGGPQVQVGYGLYRMTFDPIPEIAWDTNQDGLLDDHDVPLSVGTGYGRADGFSFGLGRTLGDRFGIGLAGFIPVDRFVRFRSFDPSIPTWFMYENRPYRYDFSAGFGWQQLPGLYVGGAVEVLARAHFELTATIDVGASIPREGEGLESVVSGVDLDLHDMEFDMRTSFAPTAAILWDLGPLIPAAEGWRLSLAYRGASGIPVEVLMNIQADIEIEETEELEALTMAALLPFQVSLLDHYVPWRLSGGVAYSKEDKASAYVDVIWTGWGAAVLNVAVLESGSVQLPVVGSSVEIQDGNEMQVEFTHTLGMRAGGELVLPSWTGPAEFGRVGAVLRAGGGYEPSSLKAQGTDTRLLDTDRAWVSIGGGLQHHDPLSLVEGPLAWDAYVVYHFLAPGALGVDPSSEPMGLPIDGADIPIGGHLLTAGVQWSFQY
jgi:hypothetical protein